jgi:hypothetical protein
MWWSSFVYFARFVRFVVPISNRSVLVPTVVIDIAFRAHWNAMCGNPKSKVGKPKWYQLSATRARCSSEWAMLKR